jgi:hypothetical protein
LKGGGKAKFYKLECTDRGWAEGEGGGCGSLPEDGHAYPPPPTIVEISVPSCRWASEYTSGVDGGFGRFTRVAEKTLRGELRSSCQLHNT